MIFLGQFFDVFHSFLYFSDFPFVYHVASFLNHFSVMSPESLDVAQ